MKLYKILMRHCAPKDCVEVVKTFVISDDEQKILCTLDKKLGYGAWEEKDNEGELFEVYDEDYNVIGEETYLQRMLRLRGEFNDDNAPFEDAYYGVTHYGWDEGVRISDDDAKTLTRLNIAENWCGE